MSQEVTVAGPLAEEKPQAKFETGGVLAISTSHFVHDTYTAFVAPLLPLMIEKLSLTLGQAGLVAGVMQLPSMLNPLIGLLNETVNLRWLVILAPAISATLVTSMGLAPNYITLVTLLAATGFSIAVYHALAPATLAAIAGKHVGRGMSFFMAAGELGRTLGPLVSVWLVGYLSLEGLLPAAGAAWLVSLLMLLRYPAAPTAPARRSTFLSELNQRAGAFFAVIAPLVFLRSFLVSALGIYLPTYLTSQGSSLQLGGASLALYQFAGVLGALAGGTLSDRLGRRRVAALSMLISSLLTFGYINTSGWSSMALLLFIGFTNLSIQPVMLALVQDHFPAARSMSNGLYLGMTFVSLAVTTTLVGHMADALTLANAIFGAAGLSLAAVPFLWLIPSPNISNPSKKEL